MKITATKIHWTFIDQNNEYLYYGLCQLQQQTYVTYVCMYVCDERFNGIKYI